MFLYILIGTIVFVCYKFYQIYTYWPNKGIENAFSFYWFSVLTENVVRANMESYFLKRIYNKFKNNRYVGFHSFRHPVLLIRDPELIKNITTRDYDFFSSHSIFLPSRNEPIWETNLVFLNHDEWSQIRKIVTPIFAGDNLNSIISTTQNYSDRLTRFVENKFSKGQQVFDLKPIYTRLCTDLMGSLVFNADCDSLNEDNEFYLRSREGMMFYTRSYFQKSIHFVWPYLTEVFKLTVITKEASKFFTNLVTKTSTSESQNTKVNPHIINLLIEARATQQQANSGPNNETSQGHCKDQISLKITDELIVAQGLIFMFAGFETLSSVASYVCYYLAVHSDIQKKVYEEIMNCLDDSGSISNNTNSLEYLNCVIMETTRLHPPSCFIDRMCTKPYIIKPKNPNEKVICIEKDTWIWMLHREIQHDKNYFANPEKFIPDRFNKDNKHTVKRYSYLAFGAGPKMCIGYKLAMIQLKILVANLLMNFELVRVPETKSVEECGITKGYPIDTNGIWLRLNPRIAN